MKKLNKAHLIAIKGGGCNRWLRRAIRAADDEEVWEAVRHAYKVCIEAKYT